MAKCIRCERGGLFKKLLPLSNYDAYICADCFKELGYDPKNDMPLLYRYDEIKEGRAAAEARRAAKAAAHYEFNVHWDDEKTEDILEKFQREWTDREDRYEGMTKKDIRESCVPGEKIFKYPPLDVDLELKRGEIDGKTAVLVYLIDGAKNPLIGYAPKTKAKKILQLLDEHQVYMSAELSGGDYRELVCFSDGEAVCDSNIPKPLKIQVRLDWSSEIE